MNDTVTLTINLTYEQLLQAIASPSKLNRKRRGRPRKLSPEQELLLVADIDAGFADNELMPKYGIGKSTIVNLRRLRLPPHSPSKAA